MYTRKKKSSGGGNGGKAEGGNEISERGRGGTPVTPGESIGGTCQRLRKGGATGRGTSGRGAGSWGKVGWVGLLGRKGTAKIQKKRGGDWTTVGDKQRKVRKRKKKGGRGKIKRGVDRMLSRATKGGNGNRQAGVGRGLVVRSWSDYGQKNYRKKKMKS